MVEVLQKNLEKALKKKGIFYTRLRTPSYGQRGVRYPADYILWLRSGTYLVECKQRKDFPLVPSNIRQLPFMKRWSELDYIPAAYYVILVYTEEDGYCVFNYSQAVVASSIHKGLKKDMAIYHSDTLPELIQKLEESNVSSSI